MTDKEKARAYDEALERAKNIRFGNPQSGTANTVCEEIFPELAESEDESVRKSIIHILQVGGYMSPEEKDKAFVYLEKMKEANKAIEVVDRIDKYIDENAANAHDMKDSNPDKKYYRGWDDALGEMARILQDVYSGKKQKEQKLNPDKKELIRQCVGSILTDATDERFKDYGLTLKDCLTWLDEREEQQSVELDKIEILMKALRVTNAQIGELVEENYKLKEQKSDNYSEERKLNHEWTSEDWSMLCDIRRYIEGTGSSSGITNQERAAWLCELPKRFSLEGKEQKPAEWSEEDKHCIHQLILFCENCMQQDSEAIRCATWLKSLRPQPHWKPSEEQIKAIDLAIRFVTDDFDEHPTLSETLRGLYNELKKL